MSRATCPEKPTGESLTAWDDVPRLVIVHGLQTPCGGPVLARATGHARRPVLTALVSFATLAAQGVEGGAA